MQQVGEGDGLAGAEDKDIGQNQAAFSDNTDLIKPEFLSSILITCRILATGFVIFVACEIPIPFFLG